MSVSGVMTKFRIDELSGVDKPAQTGAKAVIIKRDFSAADRKSLAASGAALPDGSFPIEDKSDLANAVRLLGHATNHAEAKAHIIRRAHALGATDALPAGWTGINKGTPEMTPELKKALGLSDAATDTDVVNALVAKANASEAEAEKAKQAAAAETEKCAAAEKALRKASMTDAEKAHTKGMSDADADDFMAKSKAERETTLAKAAGDVVEIGGVKISKSAVAPEVLTLLKAQSDTITSMGESFAKAQEAIASARFSKMASEDFAHMPGTVEERAAMLKGIHDLPEAVRETTLTSLRAAEAIAKSAFSWAGPRTGDAPGFAKGLGGASGADAEIEKRAKEYQKSHAGVTFAKATEAVLEADPELYAKAKDEQRARAAATN